MGMAWCKVSSLTAAVSRTLAGERFQMPRSQILRATEGKVVEGWELNYFLSSALTRKSYPDLRTLMSDLSNWLEAQG
jgi:hypothetical protein